MFSKLSITFGALIGTTSVLAHGSITNFEADGVHYEGFYYWHPLPNTSPGWAKTGDTGYVGFPDIYTNWTGDTNMPWVLNDENIICANDATPGPTSATVHAGGDVRFNWGYWPQDHHGPIMTYMADCRGPCETVDKTKLEWFKIQEMGLTNRTKNPDKPYSLDAHTNSTSGTWAVDWIIDHRYNFTVQIPSALALGSYVICHETILLHLAKLNKQIQSYPFCFNFKVTGTGTVSPQGVLGTQLYNINNPAFYYNL
ncbi:Polysaccharide monooxygenase Cel61a [Lachnellula suecica]|uniref:Polysaccharide monooxygenase Cel61a n=1 Tax=Lachnellula suecica TaxID=602035 RepID=A0A8T9C8P3_9HELO|nr:Polysaccharide monooxygenase Cel61a [Lachnellula suecica]